MKKTDIVVESPVNVGEININEVIERVAKDPYSEGVLHGGLHPSSIADIVSQLFWSPEKNFSKVTMEIVKETDDYHISVKVTEREL